MPAFQWFYRLLVGRKETARAPAAEIRLLCEQDYLLPAQGKLHQWREALLRSGMKPLAGRGLELVLLGEVDPMDAARSTGLTLPEAV